MTRILITGAKGRMGLALVACAPSHAGLEVVGQVDQGDPRPQGGRGAVHHARLGRRGGRHRLDGLPRLILRRLLRPKMPPEVADGPQHPQTRQDSYSPLHCSVLLTRLPHTGPPSRKRAVPRLWA